VLCELLGPDIGVESDTGCCSVLQCVPVCCRVLHSCYTM